MSLQLRLFFLSFCCVTRRAWHVADRFDVVAIGVEDERAIVVRMVMRTQARLAVVPASGFERHGVKPIDGGAIPHRIRPPIHPASRSNLVNRAATAISAATITTNVTLSAAPMPQSGLWKMRR